METSERKLAGDLPRQNWGWQPPALPDTVGGETIPLQARDGVADNG